MDLASKEPCVGISRFGKCRGLKSIRSISYKTALLILTVLFLGCLFYSRPRLFGLHLMNSGELFIDIGQEEGLTNGPHGNRPWSTSTGHRGGSTDPADVAIAGQQDEAPSSLPWQAVPRKRLTDKQRRHFHDQIQTFGSENNNSADKNINSTDASKGTCTKFVVATSAALTNNTPEIFEHQTFLQQQVDRLVPDWCLVIVGKQGDSILSQSKNVVYMDPESQSYHSSDMVSSEDWRWKRHVGYLYAIAHGATMIYDISDANDIQSAIIDSPIPSGAISWSIYDKMNIYGCLMSPGEPGTVWPRGFPLDWIQDAVICKSVAGETEDISKASVLQYVELDNPDVDVVYQWTGHNRHNSKLRTVNSQHTMAEEEPPVVERANNATLILRQAHFYPYTSQHSIHLPSAFWGLLFPISVSERVSDVWRSYITQRLLYDLGQHVSFTPLYASQQSAATEKDFHAMFEDEMDLYRKGSEFVRYLKHWRCNEHTMDHCLLQLYLDLYSIDVLSLKDLHNVVAWIKDLKSVGYEFPRNRRLFGVHYSIGLELEMGLRLDFPFEGKSKVAPWNHMPEVVYANRMSPEKPQYSIAVAVFNREKILPVVLTQLMKLTTSSWELLLIFDGCTDQSIQVAMDTIDGRKDWDWCIKSPNDLDVLQVWESGRFEAQGDIGKPCVFSGLNSTMTRLVLLSIPDTGIYGSAVNNIHFQLAEGEFVIIVDDDQIMTVPGWNEKLSYPLRKWKDVYSVSMRCAHGWPSLGQLTGTRCRDTRQITPMTKENICRYRVRDSGNRGPLLVRKSYAALIHYFDEIDFAGMITNGGDDHDMHLRAYRYSRWVSGVLEIPYTEDRCCRSPTSEAYRSGQNRFNLWWQTVRESFDFASPAHYQSETHDEDRVIEDANFNPLCG